MISLLPAAHQPLQAIPRAEAQRATPPGANFPDDPLLLQFLDVCAYAKANNRDGRYNSFIAAVKEHFVRPAKPATTPTPTPAP